MFICGVILRVTKRTVIDSLILFSERKLLSFERFKAYYCLEKNFKQVDTLSFVPL